MNKIGIFYGSDTGNTEKSAYLICEKLKIKKNCVFDISQNSVKKIRNYDILFFGVSTWYYGELQTDWEEWLLLLKKISFKNKIIALFGCGDQEDYSEYFCDSLGILYNFFSKKKVNFVGKWPIKKYHFEASKALLHNSYFCGLPLDFDRQPELTKIRISLWVSQVLTEIQKLKILFQK
ncbi:flavodoxin [Buchnera aphidicola]|uniref:Flavodoxin n=1 Tax=Buchnera aphidicola subsp. Tuberolachnus salignus TaxID=98804 RepID=A0A161K9R5_BUCTT|nr:flavodoxin [Buchnera aphidicola]CUR53169.1 Flavodoxin-1 [Buchnera aphidicola (Tuberolachnus salignus)]